MSIQDKFEAVTLQLSNKSIRLDKAYMIGPIIETADDFIFMNNKLEDLIYDPKEMIDENMMCRLKDNTTHQVQLFHNFSLNENALDFTKFKLQEQKLYLLFNLCSLQDRCALIRVGGKHVSIKVWINGHLYFNDRLNYIDTELILCRLNQGNNIVFVELHEIAASLQEKMLSFYVSDYTNDLDNDLLRSFYEKEINNKIRLIQRRWDFKDRFLDFIVIQKDFIHVMPQKITITIKDRQNKLIDRMDADFGEFIRFDTDIIPYNKNDFLFVDVDYLAERSIRTQRFIFLLNHATEHYETLCERIHILRPNIENMEYITCVRNWLEYIDKLRTGIINSRFFENYSIPIYHHDVQVISQYLNYMENKTEQIEIGNSKYKFSFFKSRLDNSLIRYDVKLPDDYSQDKQYPLLIYIPNAIYEDQVIYCLSHNVKTDMIVAEISCRGMTFGSYIGETAFFECLSMIWDTYPINKKKIYAMGSCSGAYAALLLAQSYPDLFAGLVVSNGEMDINKAMNLTNIPIFNLCTELSKKMNKVYLKQTELCKATNSNYVERLLDISQDSLTYMVYNTDLLTDWLLNYERKDYPDKVYFQSYYMRHHRSYGYDILKKSDNTKPCIIEGKLSGDRLDLKLQNVARLRIILPENNKKSYVSININNGSDAFTITQTKQNLEIALIGSDTESSPSIDMGMLQIYMDRLHIVIPSAYSSEIENKIIQNLAHQFSKPKSSGYEPDIYADYPIIVCNQRKEELCKDSNLILIGNACDDLPDKIKDTMPIIFHENGFEYKGYHKYGKYFVMYIHPNNMNGKYIMLVYANDPFMYHNIYTRKMLIPTYLNSIQSDYGKVGLLYDGAMYYCIKNTGDDIVKLTGML